MSRSQQMFDYMSKLQPEGGADFIALDPGKMAQELKINREDTVKLLSAWNSTGRIELVKDNQHGRTSPIIGFRNLVPAGHKRTKPRPERPSERAMRLVAKDEGRIHEDGSVAPPKPRRLVQTPELDRLHEASSAMDQFVSQFPGVVDEARARQAIRIDPDKAEAYATEGLALLARNEKLEARMREVSRRNQELERELGYKRTKENTQLREALTTAGVVHSTD